MDYNFDKLYACDESEDWLECMEEETTASSTDATTIENVSFSNFDYYDELTEPEIPTKVKEVEEEYYPYSYENEHPDTIKVAMYLQTYNCMNYFALQRAIKAVKKSDADILVFPETCYIPFRESVRYRDIFKESDRQFIFEKCLEFSREVGRAVVISTDDGQKIPYSVFANARANVEKGEQQCVVYVKHTMAHNSAFDAPNYEEFVKKTYEVVNFRGFKIGMSICYDCNHAAFGRMFGKQNIDLMLNSTGGNVVYSKWYRYNKARAVENHYYNLVTMGDNGFGSGGISAVYGFNANGGELKLNNICGSSKVPNALGGIYVFEVSHDPGKGTVESGFTQKETPNKNSSFVIPVGNIDAVLANADVIKPNLYRVKSADKNVILCVVEDEDIFKPEKVLGLLYAKELKKYRQKRYIIVNKFANLDRKLFAEKLSIVLKVRSMENFCAVVLESDIANKCYQCGKSKSSQTVKATDGKFLIDLSRTTGPEAVWADKNLMKKKWREGYEYLIDLMSND